MSKEGSDCKFGCVYGRVRGSSTCFNLFFVGFNAAILLCESSQWFRHHPIYSKIHRLTIVISDFYTKNGGMLGMTCALRCVVFADKL